jgi:hypothetical protein
MARDFFVPGRLVSKISPLRSLTLARERAVGAKLLYF